MGEKCATEDLGSFLPAGREEAEGKMKAAHRRGEEGGPQPQEGCWGCSSVLSQVYLKRGCRGGTAQAGQVEMLIYAVLDI